MQLLDQLKSEKLDSFCFAPFAKGGYGGFAFGGIWKQEQIPLGPPFSKGEDKPCYPAAPMILGSGAVLRGRE